MWVNKVKCPRNFHVQKGGALKIRPCWEIVGIAVCNSCGFLSTCIPFWQAAFPSFSFSMQKSVILGTPKLGVILLAIKHLGKQDHWEHSALRELFSSLGGLLTWKNRQLCQGESCLQLCIRKSPGLWAYTSIMGNRLVGHSYISSNAAALIVHKATGESKNSLLCTCVGATTFAHEDERLLTPLTFHRSFTLWEMGLMRRN